MTKQHTTGTSEQFVETMYKSLKEYANAGKLADLDDGTPKVLTIANVRHMAATDLLQAHREAVQAAEVALIAEIEPIVASGAPSLLQVWIKAKKRELAARSHNGGE